MGKCIEKLPHEECGSSDALQVFEEDGKYHGYCFACDTYIPDPYHGEGAPRPCSSGETRLDVEREMARIMENESESIPSRKLRKETVEYFGIKCYLNRAHYYPYKTNRSLVAYKCRLLSDKIFFNIGDIKSASLFGWEQAIQTGAKRLFITEGELDAASLFQAIKDKHVGTVYSSLNPAVVSLVNGSSSAKRDISKHLSTIKESFKEVVLVFDQDEAGEAAQRSVLSILPTAMTATIPGKDPSDCVQNGHSKGLANSVLFKAKVPKNTRLVNASDLYDEACIQAQMGLSWPWEGLTKLTRGMRYGETYYLGAGVKMGKSEIVNTLAAHLITEHSLSVFLAKPEEANRKTVQMVLGKVVGRMFHDPDKEFDYDAYEEAQKRVDDKLFMLSLYQHVGWDSLRDDILLAVQEGCRAAFIDPISNLVNGVSSSETNRVLQEIAQDLAAMAKDLDILIFIFCHLKSPENGAAHERGGKVYSHQFSGSRAMMRSCNMMLGIEGNKDPDLEEEERNVRKIVLLEDREFGAVGQVRLYWDHNTGLFAEIDHD